METTYALTRAEIDAVWKELKMHMQQEPAHFDRLMTTFEKGHAKNHEQIEIIARELQELRLARSRDKGFWAGAAFVFTAIGGIAVTAWHKFHGG